MLCSRWHVACQAFLASWPALRTLHCYLCQASYERPSCLLIVLAITTLPSTCGSRPLCSSRELLSSAARQCWTPTPPAAAKTPSTSASTPRTGCRSLARLPISRTARSSRQARTQPRATPTSAARRPWLPAQATAAAARWRSCAAALYRMRWRRRTSLPPGSARVRFAPLHQHHACACTNFVRVLGCVPLCMDWAVFHPTYIEVKCPVCMFQVQSGSVCMSGFRPSAKLS